MNIQRILVIEDDLSVYQFIESHLKRRGFSVTGAHCISDARGSIAQDSFDLIISDIRFPDGDGIELLKSLRQERNSVSHITMTGYGSISSAVEAIRQGSFDYLVKPFTLDQLDVAIERLESWKQITNENDYLRSERAEQQSSQLLLGNCDVTMNLKAMIDRVAGTKATVLIQGESGTGKELVARAIWQASPRKSAPFIKLNCAAVPENLLESELFGHEKGAFTGAVVRRDGRFQMASGGTLLLDEISEIPLALQAKLLRVLQESEFERVGSNKTVKVDVRILATTNRDLKKSIEKGEFREDLYYRLNVFPIFVPPLRERRDDIEIILNHYLEYYAGQYGKAVPVIEPELLQQIKGGMWKGNIRELQNAIARAVILNEPGRKMIPEDFGILGQPSGSTPVAIKSVSAPASTAAATTTSAPVQDDGLAPNVLRLDLVEKSMIEKALVQTKGNKTHAAKLLGISVRTLRNKLHEYRMSNGEDDSKGEAGEATDSIESEAPETSASA